MNDVIPIIAAAGLEIDENSYKLFLGLIVLGGVFFLSTIAEKYLQRKGVPTIFGVLIISLTLAMFKGNLLLNYSYDQVHAFHTLSLALILFYAGLETRFSDIRSLLRYGVTLAVVGVIISSFITGGIFYFTVSDQWMGWPLGISETLPLGIALLIGCCLGSTDAGPTLNILQTLGDVIPGRVKQVAKFESTVNDPAAVVFFSVVLGMFIKTEQTNTFWSIRQAGEDLVEAFGTGLLIGGLFGAIGVWLISRFVQERQQLLVASISIASLSYGTSALLEGSGFLAAFISGMFLNQARLEGEGQTSGEISDVIAPFNNAAEVFIALLFGLSINLSDLIKNLPAGLVMAALMMAVARPISVLIFQWISPLSLRESLLVSWCGLRGVVPLALSFEIAFSLEKHADLLPAGLAGELAAALEAEKLILLTDTPGILMDKEDPDSLIRKLRLSEARQLIKSGVVAGGMTPKTECCIRALAQGVSAAHIVDGRVPHALLLEVFTDAGIGTMVVGRG